MAVSASSLSSVSHPTVPGIPINQRTRAPGSRHKKVKGVVAEHFRILVVDDDLRNVGFLRDSLLGPAGYATLCATDGEAAVRLALSQEPDLILLDLQLPKMDGLEVLDALKKAGQEVPAIIITAHSSESVAVQALRQGVRDYFTKPFKAADILEAVDRSLTEARLRREKEQLNTRVQSVNRELEQRLKELSIMYSISKAVASLLDLDKLLTRIVEAARYVTVADGVSLFLRDQHTREIRLKAAQGDDFTTAVRKTPSDDPVVAQVLITGEIVATQSRHTGGAKSRHLTLGVPLKVHERVTGVLCVYRRESSGPFADSERYSLAALADHAAIAIENARLYKEAQQELAQRKRAEDAILQLAYHDNLTGLPNRTLFNDRTGVALARARRYSQRLAVMLLDLDHFKKVNDTLGHSVGDELLKAVGQRLTAVLRESDTVCRMGGDEFLLLLPEIDKPEHAATAAQRILEVIREPFSFGEHTLRITTSIGIAVYPDDGEDGDRLAKRADVAMYRAKDKGRDNYQRYSDKDIDATSDPQ
jgi:diguanylate cyclase (GGDEF)-like protein